MASCLPVVATAGTTESKISTFDLFRQCLSTPFTWPDQVSAERKRDILSVADQPDVVDGLLHAVGIYRENQQIHVYLRNFLYFATYFQKNPHEFDVKNATITMIEIMLHVPGIDGDLRKAIADELKNRVLCRELNEQELLSFNPDKRKLFSEWVIDAIFNFSDMRDDEIIPILMHAYPQTLLSQAPESFIGKLQARCKTDETVRSLILKVFQKAPQIYLNYTVGVGGTHEFFHTGDGWMNISKVGTLGPRLIQIVGGDNELMDRFRQAFNTQYADPEMKPYFGYLTRL